MVAKWKASQPPLGRELPVAMVFARSGLFEKARESGAIEKIVRK